MYLGLLFGPATAQFDDLKIRVFYPGGDSTFEANALTIEKDNTLLLHRVTERTEKEVVLGVVALFVPGGWLGIENQSKTPIPSTLGFKPHDQGSTSVGQASK